MFHLGALCSTRRRRQGALITGRTAAELRRTLSVCWFCRATELKLFLHLSSISSGPRVMTIYRLIPCSLIPTPIFVNSKSLNKGSTARRNTLISPYAAQWWVWKRVEVLLANRQHPHQTAMMLLMMMLIRVRHSGIQQQDVSICYQQHPALLQSGCSSTSPPPITVPDPYECDHIPNYLWSASIPQEIQVRAFILYLCAEPFPSNALWRFFWGIFWDFC